MRWYYSVGKKVWVHEVLQFLFFDKRIAPKVSLQTFWGNNKIAEGEILARPHPKQANTYQMAAKLE